MQKPRRLAQRSDLSQRAPERSSKFVEHDSDQSGVPLSDRPAAITPQFRPLDPGIVNEAIPAFFIGRNKEGFWVARDVNGRIGGVFLLERSAVSFAKGRCHPTGCATIFPAERFELDLENSGNPLVTYLGSVVRLGTRFWRQTARFVGK